ncbi:MAG TPA: glycosyltransferase family 2 protein, partial [Gammaproteobacteria bacterium]|nr:glycosyltransferase family 2 protein [Gammaproteobacteria bacterium]
ADEILILDSGSDDGTEGIAKNHGARFLHQDWLGYGDQKQAAVDHASHEWVLCIDADEWLSDELSTSIQSALQNPSHQAYTFARCNRFMGRWLRHGEGYPDLGLRLFNRRHARWSDDPIHEKVIADCPVGRLDGDLMHESETSLEDYLAKQNRYTSLQAAQMYKCGKKAGVGKLLFNPVFRFVKFYLFRLGFLDGLPGLVHISIGCFNTFIKYAKLIALHNKTKA